MNTVKQICCAMLCGQLVFLSQKAHSQDFIRLGLTHDFRTGPLLQTFSFALNRTESAEEKKGKYLLFSRHGYYLLPTSSVNIGDGVSSSENNVLLQLYAGKVFFSRPTVAGRKTRLVNAGLDLNPSFNSDKDFFEKITYGQFKGYINWVSMNKSPDDGYNKYEMSVAPGIFTNLGSRSSKTYGSTHLYSTAGLLLDFRYKTRSMVGTSVYEDWNLGVSGNYYYIASEIAQLTTDRYAGSINVSVDKRLVKNLSLGLVYKYNTDNPAYKIIHTMEIDLKITY